MRRCLVLWRSGSKTWGLGHKPDTSAEDLPDMFPPMERSRMRAGGPGLVRPQATRAESEEPIYKKSACKLDPMAASLPAKNANGYPRPPSGRRSGLVGPYTTPPIVNYKYMTSTRREGYFVPTTPNDVNIFIWTSRKSVGHKTNDRVMVHGDGTRG